jgi:hypothetical protein
MNSRAHKTLEKVFIDPPPSDCTWIEIESLLVELTKEYGGVISRGPGARTLIKLNGVKGVFPYPQRPNVGTLRYVREYLDTAGIRP